MRLEGDANDYLGKGLSGGRLIVHPHRDAPLVPHENVIAGNVIAYGATAGEIFVSGLVGERFCVRNSGVTAVVEGVGDHACEYMTGGRVVVLGATGRNFAAGMSGGIAFVYDPNDQLIHNMNYEMVDLEPLSSADEQWLKEIIARHFGYTKSEIASEILASWTTEVSHFRKVMPRDYKRVLKVLEEASEKGLSEDETSELVMEVARG
jgi:glutamate synthase (NADPH/NADH) large chain